MLAAVLLAAFWPVATGARSFFHMDLYYEHLPIWAATQRALAAGQSPFWLEGEYCGQAPLFHQEAPVFYPPTVPLLLTGVPVHRLADLFTLFHFWLAGFGAFLLVRGMTGRFDAGLFAGVAWMLSARMVQSALWPNAVAVSALVPFILYGLWLAAHGRRRAGVLSAAIAGGLSLLAARPHVLLAAAPLLAAFAAAMVWISADRARTLLDFGLAAGLALALGAPSVVPSAALLPETSRHEGLAVDATDFQPLSQGHELDMVFLPVDGRTRWPESAAYAGAFALALFLCGLGVFALGRRAPLRPEFLACAIGGIAGLVLAFGNAGPYRYIAALPVLRGFRVPERFLFSWSLALALGSALVLARWLGRTTRPRALAALAVLGLAADLVVHARRAAPTAEAALYAIEPAVVPQLAARLGVDEVGFPRRFLSVAPALNPAPYPDAVRQEVLRDAGALKGALGLRYGLASAHGAGPAMDRIETLLRRPSARALALAGVAVVVQPGMDASGAVSPLAPPLLVPADPLPRAFLVGHALVAPTDDAVAVSLSPAVDPRRTAVIEEGEPLERAAAWSDAAATVRLVARGPVRVALEATLPAPGMLVLLDTYEAGWRASVDGAAAPVLRANAAFRAVRLPAGRHSVDFFYVPPGLREGLAIGLAGLLGLALAALRLPRIAESRGLASPTF